MRRQRQQKNRRGAALVEMALVLPIFVTVVLGIVEFGRAMMVSQLVSNGAREGARLAIIDGNSNSDVEQAIREFLLNSANVQGGDVAINITITPAPGNTTTGNEVSTAQPRDLVKVQVQVPFDKVNYVTGKYLAGKNLSGEAAMRHE